MMERALSRAGLFAVLVFSAAAIACGDNPKPVARPLPPPPPPPDAASAARKPPSPPQPVAEPTIVPAEPVPDDSIASASLIDLNKNSPLKPVFFDYDSSEVNAAAQAILNDNAALLKKYGGWTITIAGHCDERGSAEYNLALGERRSVAARAYLVSIGIPAERLRTVSYGKEFPFEPGHDESAWQKNRRAHFVITGR